jgi:hypothetical protein
MELLADCKADLVSAYNSHGQRWQCHRAGCSRRLGIGCGTFDLLHVFRIGGSQLGREVLPTG